MSSCVHDTIAAIATAPGAAGIAVVRVSGPKASEIVQAVCRVRGALPAFSKKRWLCPALVCASDGALADEILLLWMRAPHSYTGEDVAELQGHGGLLPARRILRCVLEAGARPAEPGEFTKRAFLNGRLDLVQAEAVLDLIQAQSDRAAAAALEQLQGKLSRPLENLHGVLLAASADLEASLDFLEDETPPELFAAVRRSLQEAETIAQHLLATWEEGHLLREGTLVVITGRPNAGKSTLFNALLRRPRAIVAPLPGTTRDVLEETCIIGGCPIRLVDTAGLRVSACAVEQEGVRRARELMQRADLHLYVVDASVPLHAEDLENLRALPPDRCLVVLNKTDLPVLADCSALAGCAAVLKAALAAGQGVGEIEAAIQEKIGASAMLARPPQAVISERHRQALISARRAWQEAFALLERGRDDLSVPAAALLREAAEQVGQVLGKSYYPDLLDAIFSRFCVGK